MSKQAEVLIKGKRQTEGTLHSLRRQVDALGELVTSSSVDSTLSPSLSQLESSLADDCQLGPSQVRGSSSQGLICTWKGTDSSGVHHLEETQKDKNATFKLLENLSWERHVFSWFLGKLEPSGW